MMQPRSVLLRKRIIKRTSCCTNTKGTYSSFCNQVSTCVCLYFHDPFLHQKAWGGAEKIFRAITEAAGQRKEKQMTEYAAIQQHACPSLLLIIKSKCFWSNPTIIWSSWVFWCPLVQVSTQLLWGLEAGTLRRSTAKHGLIRNYFILPE